MHLTFDVRMSQVLQDFGVFILPADQGDFFIKTSFVLWKILVWGAFGQSLLYFSRAHGSHHFCSVSEP